MCGYPRWSEFESGGDEIERAHVGVVIQSGVATHEALHETF
jgi:hypothetical protein